jgi:hypothetical protein
MIEFDDLPFNVRDILNHFDEEEDAYKEMSRIESELEELYWFMDYDLSGEIVELRPMTESERKEYDNKQLEKKTHEVKNDDSNNIF